jgi:hypothetical protein
MTLENDDNVFYMGGDDSNPVSFLLSNLGFTNRTGPLYLHVGVWPTNYENSAHQWATVSLNGNIINKYCTPDQSCGNRYYPCISWMDVSRNLSSAYGGSLQVEVSSSDVKSGPCDYNGYPLYVQVFLTELPPPVPQDTLTIWVILGVCIFVALVLVFGAWYYFSMNKEKEDVYSSAINGDIETETNQKPLSVKSEPSPRRSPRLNQAKVVPTDLPLAPLHHEANVEDKDVEAARNLKEHKSMLAHYELDE